MIFTLLLGFSSLFVAGCAAYFSVLGIATLFSGHYIQVAIMASSLELGKLIATSYLYRYWSKTTFALKVYLVSAVLLLMGITSMGIFGYLSSAYQVNSSKFSQIDSQIALIESQKEVISKELEQNAKRIETLNQIRIAQEQRVQQAGNYKVPREQAYAAIDKANQELQIISQRNTEIQSEQFNKDSQILQLKQQISEAKDIGTFKFVADAINKPLDTVVIVFICVLICVFDPLAVSLVLAFNIATSGKITKEESTIKFEDNCEPKEDEPAPAQPTSTGVVLKGISASAKLKTKK